MGPWRLPRADDKDNEDKEEEHDDEEKGRTRKERMNLTMINISCAHEHFDVDVILHENNFGETISCNVSSVHCRQKISTDMH